MAFLPVVLHLLFFTFGSQSTIARLSMTFPAQPVSLDHEKSGAGAPLFEESTGFPASGVGNTQETRTWCAPQRLKMLRTSSTIALGTWATTRVLPRSCSDFS